MRVQRRRKRNDRCEQKEPHHYAQWFIDTRICCGKENAKCKIALVAGMSPESGPFVLQPARLPLERTIGKDFAKSGALTFANSVRLTERKTPPSGRPGQVKALDGVSPQPQDRQLLTCALQAFVVEVPCCTSDDVPLKVLRRANRVGRLRCLVIFVFFIILVFFVGISRRDHG